MSENLINEIMVLPAACFNEEESKKTGMDLHRLRVGRRLSLKDVSKQTGLSVDEIDCMEIGRFMSEKGYDLEGFLKLMRFYKEPISIAVHRRGGRS